MGLPRKSIDQKEAKATTVLSAIYVEVGGNYRFIQKKLTTKISKSKIFYVKVQHFKVAAF